MLYFPQQNVWLGEYGLYTEEELDEALTLEHQWKLSNKKLSFYDLLAIFPEAKGAANRNLKEEIKDCREKFKKLREVESNWRKLITTPGKIQARDWWFFEDIGNCCLFGTDREYYEKKIKKYLFQIETLKNKTHISSSPHKYNIEQAKEVPIETILEVNGAGFARCPFHEDKSPSLKVYKNQNRWYCFSCQTGTDVIDLVMKMDNTDFIAAVKKLTK